MSFKDKPNLYQCEDCQGQIITVDRVDGTTPMMLACRATKDCEGEMQSAWYRVDPALVEQATYEWYTPDAAELATMSRGMQSHVEQGGLALREIAGV